VAVESDFASLLRLIGSRQSKSSHRLEPCSPGGPSLFRPATGDGSPVISLRAAFLAAVAPRISSVGGAFVSCLALVGSRVALVAAWRALARRLYSSATERRSTWIIIQCVRDVECAAGVSRYAGGRSIAAALSPPRYHRPVSSADLIVLSKLLHPIGVDAIPVACLDAISSRSLSHRELSAALLET
jgi:hypothetical protein